MGAFGVSGLEGDVEVGVGQWPEDLGLTSHRNGEVPFPQGPCETQAPTVLPQDPGL